MKSDTNDRAYPGAGRWDTRGVQLAETVYHCLPELQAHVSFDPEIISINMYSKEIREGYEEVHPKIIIKTLYNATIHKPGYIIIADWLHSYA